MTSYKNLSSFNIRIMIDRELTEPEARSIPEVMDLCPQGGSFLKKFEINKLPSNLGPPVRQYGFTLLFYVNSKFKLRFDTFNTLKCKLNGPVKEHYHE